MPGWIRYSKRERRHRMHDFLRCIPVAGFFIGAFGSVATADQPPVTAFILLGIAAASVAFMRWDGNCGID